MNNPLRHLREHVQEAGTGTATQRAEATHKSDLERTVPVIVSADTDGPADVALANRTIISARVRTTRPAGWAERRIAKANKMIRRREDFEQRRRHSLSSARFRNRLAEVAKLDRSHALSGKLFAFLPVALIYIVAAGMALNDPLMILGTIRKAFDVPESVGLFELSNPDVVISISSAVVVFGSMLGLALAGGKAIATVLFRRPLITAEFPEAIESKKLMPARAMWLLLGVFGMPIMIGLMLLLHELAQARFQGDVEAVFTGASGVNQALTWFITLMPLLVIGLEVWASVPALAHARQVARWSSKSRFTERSDIVRHQWQLRRESRAIRLADLAVIKVSDVLADVSLRALHEVTESAITTGKVSLADIAKTLRGKPSQNDSKLELDLSGRPTNSYLQGLPVVSQSVANVLTQYVELRDHKVPTRSQLAADWHDVRANPVHFCLDETDEIAETSLTCDGEPRQQRTSPGSGIHSLPDPEITDPVDGTAA